MKRKSKCLLNLMNDYQLEYLCHFLLDSEAYEDLSHLIRTNKRVHAIGQPLLRNKAPHYLAVTSHGDLLQIDATVKQLEQKLGLEVYEKQEYKKSKDLYEFK